MTLGAEYDSKCDVFSFAIIMYQVMFENTRPYGHSIFNIEVKVAQESSFRPVIPSQQDGREYTVSEKRVIELMQMSWSNNPIQRPSFAELEAELGAMLQY